ncbi:SDR family NAD(P)-dependent oxidoreductase [Desulfoferula mesophila]|uniref:3-oxoacyl-ACP reductase n=1 Tax=Desulfoferula mesophila TaxID=3058419 RepID=A0AAU9EIR5_9BACT|nr:3-oxoacyl-ACP reductase [Desulfoferula mesophilus]
MSDNREVVLISGAASNIGLACAQRFARDHFVVLADLGDAGQQAQAIGGNALALQGDVTNPDDCAQWVAQARNEGPLKAVVHSAGITKPAKPIEQTSLEEWESVIRVNLTGAFNMCRAAIPALREYGPGAAMVLVSSRASKTGFAALGANSGATKAHYCASKAGVNSLTKSLAVELAVEGIRVNCVAPGPMEGTMIPQAQWGTLAAKVPLGRLGKPEEIAEAAYFLCSPKAAFITGHILDVNGGTLMD